MRLLDLIGPCAVAALVLASSLFGAGVAAAQETIRIGYAGELIDGDRKPLSGAFPLRFSLHDVAGEELWSELRWVTVLEGIYDLRLGADRPVPAALAGRSLELRIAIPESGEIMRHPLVVEAWQPPPPALSQAQVQRMARAALAARAIIAERAGRAETGRRLAGTPLDRIDQAGNLAERIEEIRTLFERERGAQIGTETVIVDRIGGATGRPYTRNCPTGWVMTGARGGAGRLVDGFQVICSRLE